MDQAVQAPGSVEDPGVPGSGAAAAPGPPARLTATHLLRGLRRALGVVPFGLYVAVFLLAPMVALAIGAFQDNSGDFTLSNVSAATHGIYLHGFWQSIVLSVISAVLPGILGLMLAYAIVRAEGGNLLRQVAITAAGVFANFGGVPLAFIFIATIGWPAGWSASGSPPWASTRTPMASPCTRCWEWLSCTCTSRSR